MKNSLLIVISLIMVFTVHSYSLNLSLKDISQYIYEDRVYISHKNNILYFYTGESKKFMVFPSSYIIHYTKVNTCLPLIEKLESNKTYEDNTNHSSTISTINMKTNKITNKIAVKSISLNKIKYMGDNKTTIIWIRDPLNLKQLYATCLYKLPIGRNFSAKYGDRKSGTSVKLRNKAYIGFKPDEEVLANLIYMFVVRRPSISVVYVLFIILLAMMSITITFQETIKKKFLNIISTLASLKICILAYINLFDKEKVLQNETRRKIYDYILENPGCHIREISNKLNKSVSTITWHLRILEKAELISSKKLGNRIIYYSSNMDTRRIPLLYLKNDTQKRIFAYLLKNPAHLRKIAKDLNMNVETVRYNLKKMENLEIVKHKKVGNKIMYYISKPILEIVDR